MFKSKNIVLSISLVFASFAGYASAQEQANIRSVNPTYEVLEIASSVAGMHQSEFERSFDVIAQFRAGLIELPQLNAMSDEQVYDTVDFSKAPYSDLTDYRDIVTYKRYELEIEMLAGKANVPVDKFQPFYHNFERAVASGRRIADAERKNQDLNLTPKNSLQSDGPAETITVTCDSSCSRLDNGDVESAMAALEFLREMRDWEQLHGSQPLGTTATIVEPESGNTVLMRKVWSSLEWTVQNSNVQTCGDVACKK